MTKVNNKTKHPEFSLKKVLENLTADHISRQNNLHTCTSMKLSPFIIQENEFTIIKCQKKLSPFIILNTGI